MRTALPSRDLDGWRASPDRLFGQPIGASYSRQQPACHL